MSNYHTVGNDLSPLLNWVWPLDSGLRHWDIQERRVANVGEWVMGNEEFKRWCRLDGRSEDNKAVLFCYGNPGVGKTFISSLVVDKLCDHTREQNTAVTCFYFDFAARKEQTAINMLGSLLRQMISRARMIPEDIRQELREQRQVVSGRKPRLGDIVKILQLMTSSQRTFMIIDALDECTAPQRFRLFDSLKEILQKSPGTRILVTGRPHICPEIETRLAGRVTSISLGPTRNDIIKFLRVRLSEDETPDAMDESLEVDILHRIPGTISDTFLLASLNIEAILREPTIYRRRERLSNMTDGLGLEDVYGATIDRIKAQGGYQCQLGMGALMWICYAEVPLTPVELCNALAIELGSTDFNAGNIPPITTVVSCCQGLITVDKKASTVRLIHFTLKEYLSARPDIFSGPHSAMAEICLTYLNSQHVKAISDPSTFAPFSFIDPSTTCYNKPFVKYCSLYWGVHAKRELSDRTMSLALELFQEYDNHISRKLLGEAEACVKDYGCYGHFECGPLHCASMFGIVKLLAVLIEMGSYDINGGDAYKLTPLAWAARCGHDQIAQMLIELQVVDPNKPDIFGLTPLSQASMAGHEGIVKILLGLNDVDPNQPDFRGQAPLSHAAKGGHEEVVRILLGRSDINPNLPDRDDNTPLSYAAGNGHEGVVRILLGRTEVGPDKPDNKDRTF